MRKAVFTVRVDDYEPELCRVTLPTIRDYAARIGADFRLITERRNPEFPPTYEKTQIFELGREYDVCILIDADIAVSRSLEDLSARVSEDEIGTWMTYNSPAYFEVDDAFRADGRYIGIASQLLVVPRACHALWEPLSIGRAEAATRSRRQFILDEYCFSRNVARHGFDVIGVVGDSTRLFHLNMNTQPRVDAVRAAEAYVRRDASGRKARALLTLSPDAALERYAERVGAELLVLDAPGADSSSGFRKFQIAELFYEYERIMFADMAAGIGGSTPDLFEAVPADQLGVVVEDPRPGRSDAFRAFLASVGFDARQWGGSYYRSSLFVASGWHHPIFVPPPVALPEDQEPHYFNAMVALRKPRIRELRPVL